jgi:FeS assembly protein IscX
VPASWTDLEDLVDALRVEHPRADPRALSDAELRELAEGLPGFGGGPEPTSGDIEALRAMWHWGV